MARTLAAYLHLCPRHADGAPIQSLQLAADEAFVWSRVDGLTTLSQLADITNQPAATVFTLLMRLEAAGAITWPADGSLRPARDGDARGRAKSAAPALSIPAAEQLWNHPALSETGDLTREERLQILTFETLLDTLSYWELLGVGEHATRTDLKRAYFELSKTYHPDRYHGRRLGSFAARLTRIFAQVKKAHDVLAHEDSRQTYGREHPPPSSAADAASAHAKAAASVSPTIDTATGPGPGEAPIAAAERTRLEAHRQSITAQRQKGMAVQRAERAARHAQKLQDLTQARIWAERAVQLDPNRTQLRILAAEVCEAAGDVGAARRHLEMAASLDKTNLDVKKLLARLNHDESNRH